MSPLGFSEWLVVQDRQQRVACSLGLVALVAIAVRAITAAAAAVDAVRAATVAAIVAVAAALALAVACTMHATRGLLRAVLMTVLTGTSFCLVLGVLPAPSPSPTPQCMLG